MTHFKLGGSLRAAFLFASLVAAGSAFAVGTDDEVAPPKPSETTTVCEDGQIWDEAAKECVAPEDATDDQAALYRDARELAWAGRLDDARRVLDVMAVSDNVLTYRGFVARKSGDWPLAKSFYQEAIDTNPNNILARSYYGQGLAERGDLEGAQAQLTEIRTRGGRVSWPELALRLAIQEANPAY